MDHHVYFWLNEERKNPADRAIFEQGMAKLFEIPLVAGGRWAVPAKVEIEPALAWNADLCDIAIEGDTVYIATREVLVVLRRVREWSGRPAYVPLAGKPAAPPLDAEDGDPALAYRGEWEPVADPDASGSAYKASGTAGARLTVRFTGRLLALHRPLAPGFAALAAICPEIASDIPCPAPSGEEAASDS
jgi:hypothetical protein